MSAVCRTDEKMSDNVGPDKLEMIKDAIKEEVRDIVVDHHDALYGDEAGCQEVFLRLIYAAMEPNGNIPKVSLEMIRPYIVSGNTDVYQLYAVYSAALEQELEHAKIPRGWTVKKYLRRVNWRPRSWDCPVKHKKVPKVVDASFKRLMKKLGESTKKSGGGLTTEAAIRRYMVGALQHHFEDGKKPAAEQAPLFNGHVKSPKK